MIIGNQSDAKDHQAVIALADEIPLFSGQKKSLKASARSLTWLKQLKENKVINWKNTYLFGVTSAFTSEQHLIDNNNPETDSQIMNNARELLQHGCNGIVVGGAGMGESLHQLSVAIRSVKQATLNTSSSNTVSSSISYTDNNTSINNSNSNILLTAADDIETDDIENPANTEGEKILVLIQELNSIKEILTAVQCGGDLIGIYTENIVLCILYNNQM